MSINERQKYLIYGTLALLVGLFDMIPPNHWWTITLGLLYLAASAYFFWKRHTAKDPHE